MSRGAEVIVAGAGALGLTCALALSRAGCAVTVCDPAVEGTNASGVAAGMLAPVFETVLDVEGPAALPLLLAARDLWPALEAEAGVRLDRSGAVAVGRAAWLDDVQARVTAAGFRGAELGRGALNDLAPGLAPHLETGLLVREDWRLDPAQALAALRAAARQAGARFMPYRVASRGTHDWLVVATGWSRDLAPELSHLQPIKGHILRAAAPDRGRLSLRSEGLYAVPTRDGVAIGATMEPGVREPEVDPARVAPLRDAAVRLLPGLKDADFAAAAGIRAATPDGLPMVGASADSRVLLAAGARRNGWLLAPLVAKIVAACVTGGDPGPHARRLDPGRFGRRTSS